MIKQKKICSAVFVFLCALIMCGLALWSPDAEDTAEETAAQTEQTVPKTPLYAGILAEFQNNEMATLEKNKEMLVTAANRMANPEKDVYTFL